MVTEDKMENLTLVDEEKIPMFNQDEDYDNYITPYTSRVGETSFVEPDTIEATSRLRFRLK